ncbi:MAG: iron-containing alcohol dehydrogenase [Coriobacteriia bacterium]|nr:iron-containing alcohol dehydrogenase [Coriobacteriia bacterium]
MSKQSLFRLSSIADAINTATSLLPNESANKIFVVSGGSFADPLVEGLRAQGFPVEVFSGFTANPLYEDVLAGVDAFRGANADLMISIGGGSAIDTAKCIGLFATAETDGTEGSYLKSEYEAFPVPHLSIPTTAGTGSEATTSAIVYYRGKKCSVDWPDALPEYVALVPEFLKELPLYHKKTAFLGALCQAIESFWSTNSTDESKLYAKKAIALIAENYKNYLAVDEDATILAMLEGSYAAGQAINISKATAAHAMSYQLTSLYGIAHGHAVALCLPKVWRFMVGHLELCTDPRGIDYLVQIFSEIDECLGLNDHNQSIEWLEGLVDELELLPLSEVEPGDLKSLVNSVNVQQLANNPIKLSKKNISYLYRQIIPAFRSKKKKKKVSPLRRFMRTVNRAKLSFSFRMKHDVDDTLVLLISDNGRSYSGSFRALYEQMHEDDRFSQFNYVWGFYGDTTKNYRFLERKGSTLVAKMGRKRHISALSRARFICVDGSTPSGVKFRKNQIIVPEDINLEEFYKLVSAAVPTKPSKLRLWVFKRGINNVKKFVGNTRKRIAGWKISYILAKSKNRDTLLSKNSKALLSYRNRFEGKTVILVGNGPSLSNGDLDKIAGLPSFACNLIYRTFPETEWRPSHYFCTDWIYSKTLGDEIQAKIQVPIFMNDNAYKKLRRVSADIIWVRAISSIKYKVHEDMLAYYYPSRATVMSFMIEMAMYMGFKNIILLGVDCTNSFVQGGHFSEDYTDTHVTRAEEKRATHINNRSWGSLEEVGEMRRDRSLEAYYALAKNAKRRNVRILNATRGGALEAFPRANFDEVVQQIKSGEL